MRRIAVLVVLLCLVVPLPGQDVVLSASSTNPRLGGTFMVTVQARDAVPFTAWNQFLRFDPAAVRLVAQSGGAGTLVSDSRGLDTINASGELRSGGYLIGSSVQGAVVLGVFTFQALRAGPTTIATDAYGPGHPFGNLLIAPVAHALTVPVSGPPLALTIVAGDRLRNVQLVVLRGGSPIDVVVDMTPDEGRHDEHGGVHVFSAIDPTVAHLFGFLLPIEN